jgi:hypothetical protein
LISQGGVNLNDARITEDRDVAVEDGTLVRVGRRRFARVHLID